MQILLKLTAFEWILWSIGVRRFIGRREMAHRVFQFIDANGNGTLAVGTIDLLTKILHGQLQFGKASFDFLEVCC